MSSNGTLAPTPPPRMLSPPKAAFPGNVNVDNFTDNTQPPVRCKPHEAVSTWRAFFLLSENPPCITSHSCSLSVAVVQWAAVDHLALLRHWIHVCC